MSSGLATFTFCLRFSTGPIPDSRSQVPFGDTVGRFASEILDQLLRKQVYGAETAQLSPQLCWMVLVMPALLGTDLSATKSTMKRVDRSRRMSC